MSVYASRHAQRRYRGRHVYREALASPRTLWVRRWFR